VARYAQIVTQYALEYSSGSPGWGVEIDLDVEMASASCPNCTIHLVEANSSQWTDIETADGSYFSTAGVEYVAGSSDSGYGIEEPAAFDGVVAVGGTVLSISSGKRFTDQGGWGSPDGTGAF
jgi:hypothetical protein